MKATWEALRCDEIRKVAGLVFPSSRLQNIPIGFGLCLLFVGQGDIHPVT